MSPISKFIPFITRLQILKEGEAFEFEGHTKDVSVMLIEPNKAVLKHSPDDESSLVGTFTMIYD